jgi:hypothetical protein
MDLTKTFVLFLNFNQNIFLVPARLTNVKEYWNEKNELRGIETMSLIYNKRILNTDSDTLTSDLKLRNNKIELGIKNNFTWLDIPGYVRYHIFLCLYDIHKKGYNNQLADIDITKFV